MFTLKQISEKSWEYVKDVLACFIDLEKAYDWVVLLEYGVDGRLSMFQYFLQTIHNFS